MPGDWQYGTAGRPWCIAPQPERPFVGRPGPIADVACLSGAADTTTARGGTFVWLEPAERASAQGMTGDRRVLISGQVKISIQAPPALRQKIARTVHRITQDHHGCPVRHPITGNPAWRPKSHEATDGAPASSISVCKYGLEKSGSLRSSVRITGMRAAQAIEGISASPAGGGPDAPESCLKEYAYGDEVIVLRISHGSSTKVGSEVVLRYSGCDHHGFDDGDRVHTLTADAVAPFITGPNAVNDFGGELRHVLNPGTGDPGKPVSSP